MEGLPIYLLLDSSGSMQGEPILSLQNGVQVLTAALQRNISTFGTVNVTAISFGDTAQIVAKHVDIGEFAMPQLYPYGCTSLGDAFELAAKDIDSETSANDYRNPWRPVIYVMTDGEPSDDYLYGLGELKKRNIGGLVVCIAGQEAQEDEPWLTDISESVCTLNTANSNTLLYYALSSDI